MADVVDLIKLQHRRVDDLLEQAQQAEPDQLAAILHQVADMLMPHSQAEESFVYPAIREYDEREAEEVKDSLAEHHHIEGLLQELLAADPSSPGYDGKLAAMTAEIRHHVAEEEQDLLPILSEKASDDEREELGARFAEETGQEVEEAEAQAARAGDVEGSGAPAEVDLTRDELYEKAKEQDIPGRSKMTKEELAREVGAKRK